MAASIEGGASADSLSSLSKAELLERLASFEQAEAHRKRTGGAEVKWSEGVTKAGKHWKHALVSGGPFGTDYYGLKIKSSEQLRALRALLDDVEAVLAEHNV